MIILITNDDGHFCNFAVSGTEHSTFGRKSLTEHGTKTFCIMAYTNPQSN